MPIKHAAIIGAGVAGLTAALAMARHGISSAIFEQADALTEVGAGLQVSPNASYILGQLGVLDALSAVWLEPKEVRLVSGTSLRQLAAVPSGNFAKLRWGSPYGTLHRATLQKALLDAVLANPLCELHLGQRIDPVAGSSADISSRLGAELIIGADGVWSKARTMVPGSPSPHFSGNIAWRFAIPAADAPGVFDRTSVTAFLGPSAHLVCYPLKETGTFNIVAITAGGNAVHDWNATGSDSQRSILRQRFSGWNKTISALLDQVKHPTFWPLYEVGTGRWHNGADTVLIGDAAHAMMPFAAQGAAMAIEDAFELAGIVAGRPLTEALDVFERHRTPRIAHLRQRAAFNRFAYHARGPFRLGRDFVLSMRPPQSLAADLDWIYGYHAIG
ncbi:FAD-binding protein [Neorhizobium sp. P12A]|uniref:FAD-dependent monooxygenase n=1 Tax=Neorhizobium sp. P12A TaxID=2268027 RepID=UPI0011F081DE|nr:FAD-dependent monooxygenase [Neorhizobium sp. P12A]KAA0694417.1 FAD-binding protein [Neorhizobium sp. P12A]